MRLVRFLTCAVVGLGLAASASAQLVAVPGTHVALVPPQGFTLARDFGGFENKRGGSSITVEEMAPNTAAEIVAAFSSPKGLSTRFGEQGVRITRIDRVALDSGDAPLAVGEQSFKGSEFVKYMTLLGGRDGKNAVLITFNLSAATPLRQSDVEAVVRSAAIGRPPSLSEKLAQVPFKFEPAPPFHTAEAMPGAVMLATLDGIDPKKPLVVIGKVPTSARCAACRASATRRSPSGGTRRSLEARATSSRRPRTAAPSCSSYACCPAAASFACSRPAIRRRSKPHIRRFSTSRARWSCRNRDALERKSAGEGGHGR